MLKQKKRPFILKEAIIISMAYLLFGSAWIYFSDDAFGNLIWFRKCIWNFKHIKV